MIIWLTGQPGAGKTTLAKELILYFEQNKPEVKTSHIDGDNLRQITQNFDYTLEGRKRNIANVHAIARYLDFQSENAMVIISVVAPLRSMRDDLKKTNKVIEVFVHTTELRGREANFSKNYQPPLADFINIDTTNITPKEAALEILKYGGLN